MKLLKWIAVGGVATVILAVAAVLVLLVHRGQGGNLSIVNNAPRDVTVSTGDEQLAVAGSAAAEILDYGCTPGDVTVTFSTSRTTTLPGPVCPPERIVVEDSTVTLQPQ